MKVSIDWGPQSGTLRLEIDSNEPLYKAARCIKEMCENRYTDLVQLWSDECPLLRRLFDEHLRHQNFKLSEMVSDAGEVTDLLLLYKRKGWLDGQGT